MLKSSTLSSDACDFLSSSIVSVAAGDGGGDLVSTSSFLLSSPSVVPCDTGGGVELAFLLRSEYYIENVYLIYR